MKYRIVELENEFFDNILNLVGDTLKIKKQILIFVNSKKNAEALAKKISKITSKFLNDDEIIKLNILSNNIKDVLDTPTEQCEMLAEIIKNGVAFHHSGLLNEQREMIEENFRKGLVKVIVCTPTLAAGVNLPAYRVLIKDLYRFDENMKPISVMEFHQMAGRAGRPDYDKEGEAIAISDDLDYIFEKYIDSEAEEVISKIAVETKLRSVILSLCCKYKNNLEVFDFMKNTFYAHQYSDLEMLKEKVNNIINQLSKIGLIEIRKNVSKDEEKSDIFSYFKTYSSEEKIDFQVTEIGKRINDLYLDPYSGIKIVNFLKQDSFDLVRYLFTLASTYEINPLFSVYKKEKEDIQKFLLQNDLDPEDLENLLKGKFVLLFLEWINEKSEKELLENYSIRPGEFRSKLEILNWLCYASEELAKIVNPFIVDKISLANIRILEGIKEELLELIKLKNIGRVRARKLYNAGIKTINDLLTKQSTAREILGKNYERIIAENKLKFN
ncbi:MAG: helicase-related protein [Candidatus Woesearchaeota archaeon]